MQSYDINLPINGVRIIDVDGDYIYYLAGTAGGADAAIGVRNMTGSDEVTLRPGQAYRLPAGEIGRKWVIDNALNQAPIIGTVLMGRGEFLDNRISGSVEVLDGGKARTAAGLAFYGGSAGGPNQAGQYCNAQLWNPVGSGRILVVSRVLAASSVGGLLQLRVHNTALMNLAPSAPVSKRTTGGAASIAQLRYEGTAAPLGNQLAGVYTAASSQYQFTVVEPILVYPNSGLVANGGPGADVSASWEFFEEAL